MSHSPKILVINGPNLNFLGIREPAVYGADNLQTLVASLEAQAQELGCTLDTLRQMYLGLYYAPGVTAEALKTSVYASCLLENLGYRVTPRWQEDRNDIITSVYTGSAEALCALCQGIQAGSPVDSFVTPEPYAMPGYTSQVIMAAGAFTLGSSIELSCDAPVREPYIAYLQGGLNFAASRAGVLLGVQRAFFDNK